LSHRRHLRPRPHIEQNARGSLRRTQNARGLPDCSIDVYVSTRLLDDGLNRLTSVSAPDMFGTASYAYDVQDNLTHLQVTAGSQPRNVDYCYDAANRLTNIESAAATYCSGATVTGLGYDAQGNLANKNGVLYAFDLGNRLRSVSSPASGYVYDGHGRRVRDVTAGSRYSLYSQSGNWCSPAACAKPRSCGTSA
jgi:hypothetical protein